MSQTYVSLRYAHKSHKRVVGVARKQKSLFCFRVYPFLCQAVCNFVKDIGDLQKDKECYVSFVDVPTRHKLRELNTSRLGTLARISGQVVRTHPVHPELVLGTFICMDCNAFIKNVEQQFKVRPRYLVP